MADNYRSLKGLVKQFLESETNLSQEEIEERIYESYQEDVITGRQYDTLTAMLEGM
mgnify:CR=1 FL=1